MRTPIRSETEAFRFAIVGALVVGVSVLVGWLSQPLVGVAVIVLALAVSAIAYLRAANPDREEPLRRAARAAHAHGAIQGTRHVLVVANEPLAGNALRERILGEGGERVEVDVLAPVLLSRAHYGVSDIDAELEQARQRLERSLRWAREQGITARGEVGDPSATTAIEDELRDFGADEVIVVTHPHEHGGWQEREQLERLRGELDVPVIHLEADLGQVPGQRVER
jgi:hypothetical protein